MYCLLAEILTVNFLSCPACSATLDRASELSRGALPATLFLVIPAVGLLSAIVAMVYRYHRAERTRDF